MALIPKVVSSSLPQDVFLYDVYGFGGKAVKIPAGVVGLDLTTLASDTELAKSVHLGHLRDSSALTIVDSFIDTSTQAALPIRGAFVTATGTPDMNANTSVGLVMNATGDRVLIAGGATLFTAATSGHEKVAILQVAIATGVLSAKDGALVAASSGLAAYPAPDAGNIVLAKLFTPASPIGFSTTTVTNANIFNQY